MKKDQREKEYFFDKPGNVRRFTGILYFALILLVITDFFVTKHPYFPWEEYPSFYGSFGLASSVVLVLAAKYILRKIVKREEDYYD